MAPPRTESVSERELHSALDRVIDAVVLARCPPREGMAAVLGAARKIRPRRTWDRLLRVNWGASRDLVEQWFRDYLRRNPPPQAVKAFWFCAPTIYANPPFLSWCGAAHFTLDDSDCRWAKPIYPDEEASGPSARCPLVPLFHAAKALGVDHRRGAPRYSPAAVERRFLEFSVVSLGYTALIVAHVCRRIAPKLWLGRRASRGVAVGFYEGNHHQLGLVTRDGWVPRPVSWNGLIDDDLDEPVRTGGGRRP